MRKSVAYLFSNIHTQISILLTPFLGAHIVAHLALVAEGYILLLEELSTDRLKVSLARSLTALFARLSIRFHQLRLALITARTLLDV